MGGGLRELKQRVEDRDRERDVIADPERVEAERLGEPDRRANGRGIRQRRGEPVARCGVEWKRAQARRERISKPATLNATSSALEGSGSATTFTLKVCTQSCAWTFAKPPVVP